MLKVFVFGNLLLDEDSLPIKLVPDLKKSNPDFKFIDFDPTEDMRKLGKNPIIIDTIVGPDHVVLLEDTENIEDSPRCSLHDLDLGTTLKLMKKTKMLESVRIIGVPFNMEKKEALKQIRRKLENLA